MLGPLPIYCQFCWFFQALWNTLLANAWTGHGKVLWIWNLGLYTERILLDHYVCWWCIMLQWTKVIVASLTNRTLLEKLLVTFEGIKTRRFNCFLSLSHVLDNCTCKPCNFAGLVFCKSKIDWVKIASFFSQLHTLFKMLSYVNIFITNRIYLMALSTHHTSSLP